MHSIAEGMTVGIQRNCFQVLVASKIFMILKSVNTWQYSQNNWVYSVQNSGSSPVHVLFLGLFLFCSEKVTLAMYTTWNTSNIYTKILAVVVTPSVFRLHMLSALNAIRTGLCSRLIPGVPHNKKIIKHSVEEKIELTVNWCKLTSTNLSHTHWTLWDKTRCFFTLWSLLSQVERLTQSQKASDNVGKDVSLHSQKSSERPESSSSQWHMHTHTCS